jgi:ATP-dependent helicase YprA (DUF1998 family)
MKHPGTFSVKAEKSSLGEEARLVLTFSPTDRFAGGFEWEIGGLWTPIHRQSRLPTVFVYDGYPGGVGISRRGYDAFESLTRDTLGVITRCPCERGCPACIQSHKCGN